nr:hypothetical protein [Tanacetum cinerariifolium]
MIMEAQLRIRQIPPLLQPEEAVQCYLESNNRLLILGFYATLTEPLDCGIRVDQFKEIEPKLHPEVQEALKRLCEDPKTTIVVLSGCHHSVLDKEVTCNQMKLNTTQNTTPNITSSREAAFYLANAGAIKKSTRYLLILSKPIKGELGEDEQKKLKSGYDQWREWFMNYLEEQTDGEAMIHSIQNGDHQFPVVAQVSLAGTAPNAIPTLKDPNNDTTKDLRDALERQMYGFEYGEQDRKAAILYEYETFKATEGELLLDTYLHYLQVINDLKKCSYKKDNCKLNYKFLNNLQPEWKQYGDVNDVLGYKKKAIVVTSDPLALVAEKTNVSKRKEKFEVQIESEGSNDEDINDLKKITALLAKAFNRKKYYAKPTNNNLRTSLASSSVNKKSEYVKSVEKKKDKKVDEKKRDMSKVKCYNCKKEGHFAKDCKKANVNDYNYYKTKMLLAKKDSDKQDLLAEDQAWMESSSDSDQEINANMVFMAKMEKVLSDSDKSSSFAEETIAEIVQICLWIINLGCSKHMMGNHALLTNFMKKFLGTVRFGNNDFAGLEVSFRKSTCFVRTGDVINLLTGDRSLNLYTIALNEVASNSSAYLLGKASSSQSWLWHQRLSHLNFATINNLVKNNLVQGLPKMKFKKDHLCSACEQGRFIGNIIDEASEVIISFIKKTQVNLQLQVQRVRTDNGTEFKRKILAKFFDEVGITQPFSAARTPQQNGVLERRNRTLVEAARTMLTFANLPLFLWAEANATACFKQNRLIIHKHFDKTPYELMNKRKPNIKFFHVFGCRCYLLNDYDDVRKLKAKGDIGVFVRYSKESNAFRIYNKRTRKIYESMNVNFDEISEMSSKQFSLEPGLSNLNKMGKSSNPLVSQVSETSKKDLEDLFHYFYDEYFDASKIMKSSTMNVETSNIEIPSNEEVFHEISESFQEESSSSSLNDDVQ